MREIHDQTAETAPLQSAKPRPAVPSERIFQGQTEIWIEHAGERYRLWITRRNRLILQK